MWLLTGGAGYIGNHVSRALLQAGEQVVVLDDLSSGDRASVPAACSFVAGSVTDRATLRAALRDHPVTGVIHLAGKKSSEESIREPLTYYDENVSGVLALVDEVHRRGIRRFVYSSSAAVYGTSSSTPIGERSALDPQTPYARSKLAGEWILHDVARSTGLSVITLRYFNVVGCGEPRLQDRGGSNLFPSVLEAIGRGERPVVFGYDYSTPDGTCVRDFVHVVDVAQAHVAAAGLTAQPGRQVVFNVGCGRGHSVLEVIQMFEKESGLTLDPVLGPRRPGDIESITADTSAAVRALGWRPAHDLRSMVSSAWQAAAERVLAARRVLDDAASQPPDRRAGGDPSTSIGV